MYLWRVWQPVSAVAPAASQSACVLMGCREGWTVVATVTHILDVVVPNM